MRHDRARGWTGYQVIHRLLGSRRRLIVDSTAAFALAALALVSAALEPADELPDITQSFDAPAILLVLAMTAPLAARRRYPRAIAILTTATATGAVLSGYPVGIGPFGPVFALHSLAYMTNNRTTVTGGIPGGVVLLAALVGSPGDVNLDSVAGNGLVILFAIAAGALLRIKNEQHTELIQQNRELTTAREAQVRSAVDEERLRIAREVHDTVGHALVAVTLQARAGQRRIDRNPSGAREALDEIEALAQHALQETRSAVSTIRTDTQRPEAAPRLSMASLHRLIQSMRGPELDVELHMTLDDTNLHPEQESAAFRIVQESLSNVVKHAGPAHATVTITSEGPALSIEITSDGLNQHGPDASGSGIHGMRERAERLGGSLTAGPTATGWRVHALLPAQGDLVSVAVS